MRAPVRSAVAVGFACALSSVTARAQPVDQSIPEYTRRPFTLPAGQFMGRVGFGLAGSSTATTFGGTTSAFGGGLHFEGQAGVWRSLELTSGFGIRIPNDGETLAADRYARVDREEIFQVGTRFIGNPYVRFRYGILEPSERVAHVGVEATVVFPLARQTVWSLALGVPVVLTVPAAHMRVETGLFWQFMVSGAPQVRNVLNVPVRVMFQLGGSVALGVVTGLYAANVGADDASDPRVPLGLQAALRISPNTDVLLQWLYPTASPYGTDAGGLGLTVAGRMR
jgi:hypothetical protein